MNFKEFKKKYKPCDEAVKFIKNQSETDTIKIIEYLVKYEKFDWAEWGLSRCLSRAGRLEWACLCAESVLPIFEAKHPYDTRPRLAIEAARNMNAPSSYVAAANDACAVSNTKGLRVSLIMVGLEILKAEAT